MPHMSEILQKMGHIGTVVQGANGRITPNPVGTRPGNPRDLDDGGFGKEGAGMALDAR